MWKSNELTKLADLESRLRINTATLICDICKYRICVYKCIG